MSTSISAASLVPLLFKSIPLGCNFSSLVKFLNHKYFISVACLVLYFSLMAIFLYVLIIHNGEYYPYQLLRSLYSLFFWLLKLLRGNPSHLVMMKNLSFCALLKPIVKVWSFLTGLQQTGLLQQKLLQYEWRSQLHM